MLGIEVLVCIVLWVCLSVVCSVLAVVRCLRWLVSVCFVGLDSSWLMLGRVCSLLTNSWLGRG